jgi:hypothetical protein
MTDVSLGAARGFQTEKVLNIGEKNRQRNHPRLNTDERN